MDAMTAQNNSAALPQFLDYGICARTLASESESGDLAVVVPLPDGALLAVLDGLGHGADAAAASEAGADVIRSFPQEPLTELVKRCHEALRRTRGAVMSVASIHARSGILTWLGIGNVEAVLFRADSLAPSARESLLLRGGVVGYQLPRLSPSSLRLFPGDTLVFATDGIDSGFYQESPLGWRPQDFADEIVSRYGKETDDAAVLVARYSASPT
jgi:serine phosphatase RsbU (regulator of sigma subunit)